MPAAIDAPNIVQLLSFANRQFRTNPNYYHPLERRDEERTPLIVPAVMQAVSPSLKPLEEPFDVVTRDISLSGIGLITGSELKNDLYTVQLTVDKDEVYVLGMIAWSEPRGPFYFAGVDIVRALQPVQ